MPVTRRLRALLMALLFVGTGFGAPLLDAVLFHRGAAVARPHVESRDNPACNGERCVIPLYHLTQGGAPAAAPSAVPVASLVQAPDPIAPRAPETSGPRTPLQSRAPPSSLV